MIENKIDDKNIVSNAMLRVLMVFMVLYFIPSIGFAGRTAVKPEAVAELRNVEAAVEPEPGMGGPSYIANTVSLEPVSKGVEAVLGGVPEPEEYSKPRMLLFSSYTVQKGDNLSEVAKHFGLYEDTLISANDVKNLRGLQVGTPLKVPNQDGIYYKVKKDDTLFKIAASHKADGAAIQTANELFSDQINPDSSLFIPGARLSQEQKQKLDQRSESSGGSRFFWPIRGTITSQYGYRSNPFTGVRSLHNGLDIGAGMGTPVKAAMSGRVESAGYEQNYGNFVVITHQSGYKTLYGHLSVIRTKQGAYVNSGDRIGDVGSTGQSTGPHLHFTVYKNGRTVNPWTVLR
jgi:murein DD-endopeptidase MepM/ murein hydrolase activator NlpD